MFGRLFFRYLSTTILWQDDDFFYKTGNKKTRLDEKYLSQGLFYD